MKRVILFIVTVAMFLASATYADPNKGPHVAENPNGNPAPKGAPPPLPIDDLTFEVSEDCVARLDDFRPGALPKTAEGLDVTPHLRNLPGSQLQTDWKPAPDAKPFCLGQHSSGAVYMKACGEGDDQRFVFSAENDGSGHFRILSKGDGRCLTAMQNEAVGSGVALRFADCKTGDPAQMFRHNAKDGSVRNGLNDGCVDVWPGEQGKQFDGYKVYVMPQCHKQDNQRFKVSGEGGTKFPDFRAQPAKTVKSAWKRDGKDVCIDSGTSTVRDCSGDEAQTFRFVTHPGTTDSFWVVAKDGKCLALDRANDMKNGAFGSKFVKCEQNDPAQVFHHQADGSLRNWANNSCLDAWPGDPGRQGDGQKLYFYPKCHGGENQKFTIR